MLEMPVEVTIFCIAYNHEKYIDRMLKGIVEQKTNFRYEVLIHDDASSDGTKKIIKKYAEQYPNMIIPIYQSVNQYSQKKGIIASILIPLAKGRYFAYCEGDDFWCDEYKLQKQFDVLEKNRIYSICVHRTRCCNEDGSDNKFVFPQKQYGLQPGELNNQMIAEALWVHGGFPFHLSSYFVRKEVYRDVENYSFLQQFRLDIAILWVSLKTGSFYFLDDTMSCYRLLSIGSWNMRFQNSDIQIKIEERKRRLRMCFDYDKLTNYMYHSYIEATVVQNVLGWCTYDPETADKIFKTIDFGTNKFISRKNAMTYRMFSCSPIMTGIYQKTACFIERKVKNFYMKLCRWWENEKK